MNAPNPGSGLFRHADALDALNRSVSLDQKLALIHEALYGQLEFVDRISVAAYDKATDLLKTFLASSPGRNDLVRYEARLSESPSLAEILRTGRPRVVDDLELSVTGAGCTRGSSPRTASARATPCRCTSTARSGDSSSSIRAWRCRSPTTPCASSTCTRT